MATTQRRQNGREVRQKGKGMKRLSTWHRKGDVQTRLWRRAVERLDRRGEATE
jgi:hypothetical protein